jgi:hypothetical protein
MKAFRKRFSVFCFNIDLWKHEIEGASTVEEVIAFVKLTQPDVFGLNEVRIYLESAF